MKKLFLKFPAPRLNLTDYDYIDEKYPPNGEGLVEIFYMGVGNCIGLGFDDNADLIGWAYKRRFKLTLKESVEWVLAMDVADDALNDCPQYDVEARADWLEMVWAHIPGVSKPLGGN